MPKDEFDFDDPLELNGVALPTADDTTDAMCECFVEEFMRMGHNPKQILALFANPHYLGMHLVWQRRGELFVRQCIERIFARWGRSVSWPAGQGNSPQGSTLPLSPPGPPVANHDDEAADHASQPTDPMSGPVPRFHL